MWKLYLLLAILLTSCSANSQVSEFGNLYNGFIYPDSTMRKLSHIVDSLNLKFKVCDFNKVFYSKPIAKAHLIYVKGSKSKKVIKDMKAKMTYDEIVAKYKCDIEIKDVLLVKFKYKNYEEEEVVEFSAYKMGVNAVRDLELTEPWKKYEKLFKNDWIYRHDKRTKYSEEDLTAYFLTEDMYCKAIPKQYASMLQYSDCLVDTNAQIYFDKAKKTGRYYGYEKNEKVNAFIQFVHKNTNHPEYSETDTLYYEKYRVWDSLRIKRCDSLRMVNSDFDVLLTEAISEALIHGGTNDEFEEYVGRYSSAKTELQLKRNRIVVGGCSMDQSPRIHALNIAVLSANTINWEIFLRSHLDIMNDRFERVSDGSYAWAGRKTYIGELEALNINVPDLILGICLRSENVNNNHYYGSISRIGRALSESKQKDLLESKMLEMIKSPELDEFNRLLMYFLMANYIHNLDSIETKKETASKAFDALKTLPSYLVSNAEPLKFK